jgi:hypothetical protein
MMDFILWTLAIFGFVCLLGLRVRITWTDRK